MYLLIPGRHHLLTQFQFDYLAGILNNPLQHILDINGSPIQKAGKIEAIIFAVTSANHSNTRRNPLPFYMRALSIDEFGESLGVPVYIYGIDDVGNVNNFSDYTIKRIRHESEGLFQLTPENTLVVCSTPVLEMYEHSGFTILSAELKDRTNWKYQEVLPWTIVEKISESTNWETVDFVKSNMHAASLYIWKKYNLASKVQMLFKDHMISDDGDITTTRDYNSYVRQMDEIAVLKF
ncbi:MAG: transferase, partial [Cyclobacteriaceae bacterium]